MNSFYNRLHAPTLASSWGTGGVILGSALLASFQQGRPILHELMVGLGIMTTVPVTLMLLGRAALHRVAAFAMSMALLHIKSCAVIAHCAR